jgi:S1-C subfamily serine protease
LLAALLTLPVAATGAPARAEAATPLREQVNRIQYLLLWTGQFAGPLDGRLDPLLLQSVRDFQSRAGFRPTGTLDAVQIKRLVEQATNAMRQRDYVHVDDPPTGAYLALPRKLLPERGAAGRGSRFAAAGRVIEVETARLGGPDFSFLQLYRSYRDSLSNDAVLQNIFRGDSFILAWAKGALVHIVRFDSDGDDVRGLIIRFERGGDPDFAPIANAMVHDFSPFQKPAGFAYLSAPDLSRFPPASEQPKGPTTAKISSGSGFVVSKRAHVLTNAHVVQDCTSITIGTGKSAKLVGIEVLDDLALLQVAQLDFEQTAQFAAEPVRLGSEVAAFGFPLRGILADQLNMTTGIVSSLAGLAGNPRFIQISAAVQPGNSGGPVIDLTGRVVGIVTGRLNRIRGAKAEDGMLPQLVNFAVRHERAVQFMRQLGLEPEVAPPTGSAMSTTDLARLAVSYTVAITCQR